MFILAQNIQGDFTKIIDITFETFTTSNSSFWGELLNHVNTFGKGHKVCHSSGRCGF